MTTECCKGRKPGCGNELSSVVRRILSVGSEGIEMTLPAECGLGLPLQTILNGGNCT